MIPPIANLLEEFESLSLDESVYMVLRTDENLEVCIHFRKKQAPKCWSIWFKMSEAPSRQQCSREHFPLVLKAFGLQEHVFTKELAGRLLTQAAFADEFVRTVGQLLGQDALRESIRSTQLFMESLKELVRKTVGPGLPDETTPGGAGTGPIPGASTGFRKSPVALSTLKPPSDSTDSQDGPTSVGSSKGRFRVIQGRGGRSEGED
jgi:hypothetical protein